MLIPGHSFALALLISFAFGVADAIRNLKDGPMIDAEGREYKSAALRTDAENLGGQQLNHEATVHIRCKEASMVIVVKADLYKNGRLISPGELVLGGAEHSQSSQCRVAAVGDSEFIIEAPLQDCGSELTMSKDSVIYTNKLIISPAGSYPGITRMNNAVPVSCHYKRTNIVSSNTQQPSLISISAKHPTPAFSLKRMTDHWTAETFSRVFYIGDLLRLEASYTGPDSGQRQLFIDSCVATLSPDATSIPRYYLIENHGCLIDATEDKSNALFQPRKRASSLQLQLDVLLFHQDSRNTLFITCHLKATSEMWKSSPINKACNYIHSRWINVDGSDVCQCCDSTCSPNDSKNLRRLIPKDVACETVTLGPLMVFPSK